LKQTFLHAQNGSVFAEQGHSVGHSQIDELLIVWVFASARCFDGSFGGDMVLIKSIQDVLCLKVGTRHALDDVGVSEHAL
jgi:hypothetical protein